MSIKIIGITGPSGAGKSLLSAHLAAKNIPIIDADEVYHSLLTANSDCTKALANEFGREILGEDGAPDRKKLGAIVFTSPEKLGKLNSIVLGFVIDKIKETISFLDTIGEKAVIVDAPTLIESGFSKECDCVVSVLSDKEERIRRICERDAISYEKASMRVSAQKEDEFYINNSHHILVNNGDTDAFYADIDKLFDTVLNNNAYGGF